jgi:hypothetical protein
MTLPDADHLIASAVNYLVQGSEFEAATVLLMCDVEVQSGSYGNFEGSRSGRLAQQA